MRLQIGRVILLVIFALVVVLNLQIAVAPQALRNDQVVRLVARREQSGARQPRRGQRRQDHGGGKDAGADAQDRPALDRPRRDQAGLPQHPQLQAGHHQPHDRRQRPRQCLQHGPAIRQHGCERDEQDDERDEREDELREPRPPACGGAAGRIQMIDADQHQRGQAGKAQHRLPGRQQREANHAVCGRRLVEHASRGVEGGSGDRARSEGPQESETRHH